MSDVPYRLKLYTTHDSKKKKAFVVSWFYPK